VLIGERPAVEVDERLSVIFERPAFPVTVSTEKMEAIKTDIRDHSREHVTIVVASDGDDWNICLGESRRTILERTERLKIPVFTVSNVTGDHDRINVVIDSVLNGIRPR